MSVLSEATLSMVAIITEENHRTVDDAVVGEDSFMPGASRSQVVLYGIEDDEENLEPPEEIVPVPVVFVEPLYIECFTEVCYVQSNIQSNVPEAVLPVQVLVEGQDLPSTMDELLPEDSESKIGAEVPLQLDLAIQEPVFLGEGELDEDENREIVHVGGHSDFVEHPPNPNDQDTSLFESIRNLLTKRGTPSGYVSTNHQGLIPTEVHLAECLRFLADQKLDIKNHQMLEDKVERAVCDLLLPFLETIKDYYLSRLKNTRILWKNSVDFERPEISTEYLRQLQAMPIPVTLADQQVDSESGPVQTVSGGVEKQVCPDSLKVRLIIADKAPSRKRSPFRRLASTMAAFTSRSPRPKQAKHTPKFSNEAPPRLEYIQSTEQSVPQSNHKHKEKPMSVRRDRSLEKHTRLADHKRINQKHTRGSEEYHREERSHKSRRKYREESSESEDENPKASKVRTLSKIEIFQIKRRGRKIPYLPSHVVDRSVFVRTVQHMRDENRELGIPARVDETMEDSARGKDRKKKKRRHKHRRSERSSRLGKRESKLEISEESESEQEEQAKTSTKRKQKISDYSVSFMKSEEECLGEEQNEKISPRPNSSVGVKKHKEISQKVPQNLGNPNPMDFQAMFTNMGMGFNPFIASMNMAAMYTMMMQQQTGQKPSGVTVVAPPAIPISDPSAMFAHQMQSWPTMMGMPGFGASTSTLPTTPPPLQPVTTMKSASPQKARQYACTAPTPFFPSPTRGNAELLDQSFGGLGRVKSPELSIKKEHMSPIRDKEPNLDKISQYLCFDGSDNKFESSISNEKTPETELKAVEPLKKREKNGKGQVTKGITGVVSHRTLQLDSEDSEPSFGSQSLRKPSPSPQPAENPEPEESAPLDSTAFDLFGLYSPSTSHPKPLPHSKPRGPPMRALIHPSSSSFTRRLPHRKPTR